MQFFFVYTMPFVSMPLWLLRLFFIAIGDIYPLFCICLLRNFLYLDKKVEVIARKWRKNFMLVLGNLIINQ